MTINTSSSITDRLIDTLNLKADFLTRHCELLKQLELEAVREANDGRYGEYTYVQIEADYGDDVDFIVYGPDAKQVMAILRKAFSPGRWDKDTDSYYFALKREVNGLNIEIKAHRDAVCQRVVVGTKTVVRKAVEARPETVEEVEEVEWVCGTLAG
jgi:predicted nucleotidyltransferase